MIHPGAMGDLIQALPAFERLRTRFTNDRLSLLVGSPFTELARRWELFDEVETFDAQTAYHGGRHAKATLFVRLAWRLRRERFDAIATFKASAVYGTLAFLAGAPVRVGLARGIGSHLLTTPLAIVPDEHREDRFLRVAAALGAVALPEHRARWPVDDAAVRALGPRRRDLLIGVAPGGARNVKEEMPERRWPAERYLEVCARLLAAYEDAHIVLLGGGADRADAEQLMRHLPTGRATNLSGTTSVAAARDVIAACRLFVTHDAGLLHLAGTTPTPIVAIFGPTAPGVVCPRRPRVEAVWQPARSIPCHDEITGTVAPCVQPCCIQRASVDIVFERARMLLEARTGTDAAPSRRDARAAR